MGRRALTTLQAYQGWVSGCKRALTGLVGMSYRAYRNTQRSYDRYGDHTSCLSGLWGDGCDQLR